MAQIESFDSQNLQAICNVLGETAQGLTGSEIGQILANLGIEDPSDGITKRRRLFDALSGRQRLDRCGNNVIVFIQAAMKPVRYINNKEIFDIRRDELNKVLSFSGLELLENGSIRKTVITNTITEAQKRASRLRQSLQSRQVHPDVLRFCKAELLQDNYFHAVFEVTKSVADKIRNKSRLTSDGSKLINEAFGIGSKIHPILAFNSLQTETEKSEHTGLMNLLKGLFGTFRNTLAHEPKIKWAINEQDAMDILTLASLLHRRLDDAVRTNYKMASNK
ncbi:MAG: TIGR02391 family protein [Anaerolineaceae bacterium]|nr:TIGR02391 family protein [Anaerolineaceae bacterium]